MTLLSEFRTDVRLRLTDLGPIPAYTDALLVSLLDRWITTNWPDIVDRMSEFYYKVGIEVTAVVDQEEYALPSDFRAAGVLRRTDHTDKPRLKLIDPFNQNAWRFANPPFIERDPEAPTTLTESWSIVGTNFKIVPAPQTITAKYTLEYYRDHVKATVDGSTVDIPIEFYWQAVDEVVRDALSILEPAHKDAQQRADITAQQSISMAEKITAFKTLGTVPDVIPFWD